MTKHVKLRRPSNIDLDRNPLIGGSKGVTMAQATPEELEELQGANTIEGDVENDTTPQGAISKSPRRTGRPSRGGDQNGKS